MTKPHPLITQLARIREAQGDSRWAASTNAGISRPSVARWESGAVSPTLSTFALYASSLGYELTLKEIPR